jgi:hypothetical protein
MSVNIIAVSLRVSTSVGNIITMRALLKKPYIRKYPYPSKIGVERLNVNTCKEKRLRTMCQSMKNNLIKDRLFSPENRILLFNEYSISEHIPQPSYRC